MIQSLGRLLRERAPSLYRVAQPAYARVLTEYRVLRQVSIRRLVRRIVAKPASWQSVLPLQSVRRIPAANLPGDDLATALSRVGVPYAEGGHALYLTPSAWRQSPLADAARGLPADAGLKIVRNPGGVEGSGYMHGAEHSMIQRRLLHGHAELTLVANLLFRHGLGPRLYDLMELELAGRLHAAYVLQHVGGPQPSAAECRAGLERLQAVVEAGELDLVVPEGFAHEDFRCPACNGNSLTTTAGEFQYVDFQNFTLGRYANLLKGTALAAAAASHFGDKSVLRGGSYLYQSVPGVDLPAKRNIDDRLRVVDELFASVGRTVADRLVLDVGCNVGMMMGQYLKRGAAWAHGWDQATVVPHTERLLLALGCSRFGVTGGPISSSTDLAAPLAPGVESKLPGCMVSYLAMRRHIGWIDALQVVPWELMLYEGHEGENEAQTQEHFEQFRAIVRFRVLGLREYRDGDSDSRIIALLEREP